MFPSLFEELDSKSLQAYVTNRQYAPLWFPLFFPFEYSPTMEWKILKGAVGHRVMADVVAPGSPAPRKKRPSIVKLTGDIPPIKLKRTLEEADINKYNTYKAMATSPAQRALLDLVYGDVDFCVDGLDGRLEWLALQALSQGAISLTALNSAGIITDTSIDFQIPTANKKVVSSANHYWTTAAYATNDPVTDIETLAGTASTAGVKIRYVVMNLSKWQAVKKSTAVAKYAAPIFVKAASLQRGPNLQSMNEVLNSDGLPQIVVVDTRVNFENGNGTISTVDPWCDAAGADRYVVLIPDMRVGSTFHTPTAEETNPPEQVLQAKRGPYLISKYSSVDPVTENTKGEVNAFPAISNPDSLYYIDTESHTTYGA